MSNPNLLKIELPEGWTEEKLLALLSKQRITSPDGKKLKRHCWKGNPCALWKQTGEHPWVGYCMLHSVDCLNAASSGETPPRWRGKES